MIKLKQILLIEQDKNTEFNVPAEKTGTIIRGISETDPWEYYYHDEDGMWKTKRRTASKFLDMKSKLIRLYGETTGNSRYETAVSRLNAYLNNRDKAEQDGKIVQDVVIPENNIEVIHINYDTQKVKEKLIDANGNRNKIVDVLGKSDDDKYLKVKLHNRGLLKRDIEVYVEADSFNILPNGTAEYNGKEGKTYNLYKISESVINEQTTSVPMTDSFTLGDGDPYEYRLDKASKIWYTKLKTEKTWQKMKDIASNYDLAVKRLEAGPRYPTKPGTSEPKTNDLTKGRGGVETNPIKMKTIVNSFDRNSLPIFKNYNLVIFDRVNNIAVSPETISKPLANAPYMVKITYGFIPNSSNVSNKSFYAKVKDLDLIKNGKGYYDIFEPKLNDDKYFEKIIRRVTNHILQNFKILSRTFDNRYYLVQIADLKLLIPQSEFNTNGTFKSDTFTSYELK